MMTGISPQGQSEMAVSVLITYHNEQELLTECLNSVARQSVPVSEVIVYDDASEMPALRYVPPSLDVRVIRGEHNVGPSRGRNVLLKEARGEFVHFHDADDLFDPDWCKTVQAAIQETNADVVITEVRSDGTARCDRVLGFTAGEVERDFLRCAIRGAVLPACGTYRKELVEKNGGYREDLWQSEDYDLNIRVAASGPKTVMIEQALVTIRVRPNSRSQNRYEVWRDAVQCIEGLAESLPAPYLNELAEKLFDVGVQLYRLGARIESRRAAQLARNLGKLKYRYASPCQALLYSVLPLPAAEALRAGYRKAIPLRWRRIIRELDRREDTWESKSRCVA
jgi:glycosyltransferase involved in cell wall biosynthesis